MDYEYSVTIGDFTFKTDYIEDEKRYNFLVVGKHPDFPISSKETLFNWCKTERDAGISSVQFQKRGRETNIYSAIILPKTR